MAMIRPTYRIVYTPSILAIVQQGGIDPRESCAALANGRLNQVKCLPDGSLLIDDAELSCVFHTAWGAVYNTWAAERDEILDPTDAGPSVLGRAILCSLSGHIDLQYDVHFIGDWAQNLEGNSIGVRTSRATHGMVEDCELQSLNVYVEFRRSADKGQRYRFVTLVSAWLRGVRNKGLFGEGPVTAITEAIRFGRRAAHFRLDASATGPITILWLVTTLIGFCDPVVITEISFTREVVRGVVRDRTVICEKIGAEEYFGPFTTEVALSSA